MIAESIPAHSQYRGGAVGPVYNEAAFRHFLAVDQSRARRSRRSLYLVLVAIRESLGRRARLNDDTAEAVFRGLGASVREVDFVGWYQEGHVAAAVLAQGVTADGDVAPAIANRVLPSLWSQFPDAQATDLRVRVVRLGGKAGI